MIKIKFDKITYIGYEELWKPIYIKNQLTKYAISTLGCVRNNKTGKILKTILDKYGYEQVCLFHDGNRYSLTVHRLVAIAFIPNPENKPEVNHKDGIKYHNEISNLEWSTEKENVIHSYATGLHENRATGENHGMNKYTVYQITKVCELLEENKKTYKEISKITGVPTSTIQDIMLKKYWNHISDKYIVERYSVKAYKYMDPEIKDRIIELAKVCNDPTTIRKKLNLKYSDVVQNQIRRYIRKYYE